jgi:hypothetical protein
VTEETREALGTPTGMPTPELVKWCLDALYAVLCEVDSAALASPEGA